VSYLTYQQSKRVQHCESISLYLAWLVYNGVIMLAQYYTFIIINSVANTDIT